MAKLNIFYAQISFLSQQKLLLFNFIIHKSVFCAPINILCAQTGICGHTF